MKEPTVRLKNDRVIFSSPPVSYANHENTFEGY